MACPICKHEFPALWGCARGRKRLRCSYCRYQYTLDHIPISTAKALTTRYSSLSARSRMYQSRKYSALERAFTGG